MTKQLATRLFLACSILATPALMIGCMGGEPTQSIPPGGNPPGEEAKVIKKTNRGGANRE
jgi:hypothetical protein